MNTLHVKVVAASMTLLFGSAVAQAQDTSAERAASFKAMEMTQASAAEAMKHHYSVPVEPHIPGKTYTAALHHTAWHDKTQSGFASETACKQWLVNNLNGLTSAHITGVYGDCKVDR